MDSDSQNSDSEVGGSSIRQFPPPTDSQPSNEQPQQSSGNNRHRTRSSLTTIASLHTLIREIPESTLRLLRAQGFILEDIASETSQRTIHELAVQVAELRIQMQKQADDWAARLRSKEAELDETKRELQISQHKENQLRDVILNKAGDAKVTDDEITEKFRLLRQDIRRMAESRMFDVTNMPDLSQQTNTIVPSSIFRDQLWGRLSPHDRQSRIASLLFEIVNDFLLNNNCFGLFNFEADECNIEAALSIFQFFMTQANVDEEMITDWVIKTIECAKQLNFTDQKAHEVSKVMFAQFSPVLRSRGPREDEEARQAFEKLSTDAFHLTMRMLSSKEGYAVERFEQSVLGQEDELGEVVGVERGRAREASDEVAYTLMGALTKHPKYRGEAKRVLEKAHVVVKRKAA